MSSRAREGLTYSSVFEALGRNERVAEREAEWLGLAAAGALLEEMVELSPVEWAAWVVKREDSQTAIFLRRLLELAEKRLGEAGAYGVELAELAVSLARGLRLGELAVSMSWGLRVRGPQDEVEELAVRAWCVQGLARASKGLSSEEEFRTAGLLLAGRFGGLAEAEHCRLLGRVRWIEGRMPEAVALGLRAADLYGAQWHADAQAEELSRVAEIFLECGAVEAAADAVERVLVVEGEAPSVRATALRRKLAAAWWIEGQFGRAAEAVGQSTFEGFDPGEELAALLIHGLARELTGATEPEVVAHLGIAVRAAGEEGRGAYAAIAVIALAAELVREGRSLDAAAELERTAEVAGIAAPLSEALRQAAELVRLEPGGQGQAHRQSVSEWVRGALRKVAATVELEAGNEAPPSGAAARPEPDSTGDDTNGTELAAPEHGVRRE